MIKLKKVKVEIFSLVWVFIIDASLNPDYKSIWNSIWNSDINSVANLIISEINDQIKIA